MHNSSLFGLVYIRSFNDRCSAMTDLKLTFTEKPFYNEVLFMFGVDGHLKCILRKAHSMAYHVDRWSIDKLVTSLTMRSPSVVTSRNVSACCVLVKVRL